MAANPDEVVSVGGQGGENPPPPSSTPADPDAVVSVGDPGDQVVAVNGRNVSGQRSGFWHDFGQGTGSVTDVLKAPFTESIPAEVVKAGMHDPTTYAMGGVVGLAIKKFHEFLASDDDKPLADRMHESFAALRQQAVEHPGTVTGSLLKGLFTDPELFFVPELGAGRAGVAAADAAKAAGASARAAETVGAVAHGAARVGGGAAIGGGAEFAQELGEDKPLDPGAIALSAGVGGVAAGAFQVSGKPRKLSPEEIDQILEPTSKAAGEAHADVTVSPTAEGYRVHQPGSAEGQTFPTKAEADQAVLDIRARAGDYRGMGTVPRGARERSKLLHENPFTPDKMADMVKRPPKDDPGLAGRDLASYWGKAALSAGIGAGLGAYLDDEHRGEGAAAGALAGAGARLLPKDRRVSIEGVINTRNGELAVMARKTLQFKAAIDSLVPEPMRRNAISLYLEGTPGIQLNPQELRAANAVRDFFDSMGNTAVDAGVLKNTLHNYVTHIVEADPDFTAGRPLSQMADLGRQIFKRAAPRERPPGTIDKLVDALVDQVTGRQASGRQFAKERKYATFGELQNALRGSGLRIKTGDIGEIMAVYSRAMFKAITDKRMIDALKATRVEGMPPLVLPAEAPRPSGAPALERQPLEGTAGEVQPKLQPPGADSSTLPPHSTQQQPPAIPPAGGAPGTGGPLAGPDGIPPSSSGFILPPEPGPGAAARKWADRGPNMLLMPAERADASYVELGNKLLSGYRVHRDIAPQLNFVLSARDPNDVTIGLMALNQASKRAIVSFSLFHAKTLMDAFIGDRGTEAFRGGNPVSQAKRAVEMFKAGGGNSETIDLLLRHGLQLQMPEDVTSDRAASALTRIAEVVDKALPVSTATKGVKGLAALNEKLDHFTFGTLQTGFKLITALDAMERLTKKGITGDRAARLASSYTNDIYGSLDWFRVANDVTSKIGRDVTYGFFNPNGRRWLQIMMFAPDWTFSTFRAAAKAFPGAAEDPALAALHRRYLAKSALYYLTIANSINMVTAGHTVFENENPTRVQLSDGRTMQFSKHFMEPAEWLRDPVQTADNKLAFLPRSLVQIGTGKEWISAHDAAPDTESRAKMIADMFLPINAQQGLAGGGAASWLGLVGMPIYGKTVDEKAVDREKKKLQALEKKKATAEYYRRKNRPRWADKYDPLVTKEGD